MLYGCGVFSWSLIFEKTKKEKKEGGGEEKGLDVITVERYNVI